jgi:hypothetical protein
MTARVTQIGEKKVDFYRPFFIFAASPAFAASCLLRRDNTPASPYSPSQSIDCGKKATDAATND